MFSISEYLKKRNTYFYKHQFHKREYSVDYLSTIVSREQILKLSKNIPTTLNKAIDIIPIISEIHTSGSTSIVYKLMHEAECYAIKIQKSERYSAFFQNEIGVRLIAIEGDRVLTQTLFASEEIGVIMSKWIQGEIIKNISDMNIWAAFNKSLLLTTEMAKKGLYDDDFTPSNIIYTNECAKLIDAGTLFLYDPEVNINPFDDELFFYNTFTRLLYKNIMVYFIRLERIGRGEKAYELYGIFLPLFIDALRELPINIHNPTILKHYESICNYYDANYQDNKYLSYIRDKYLCHVFILMENINDNYYDRNTIIRLHELICLININYDILKKRHFLIYEDIEDSKKNCLVKYKEILDKTLLYIENYGIVYE